MAHGSSREFAMTDDSIATSNPITDNPITAEANATDWSDASPDPTPDPTSVVSQPTHSMGGEVRQYQWFWQNQPINITYEVLGQGHPVLLLPAFSTVCSRFEMQGLATQLADRYQVYVLDWPGFGDSDRPKVEYAPKIYRAFLRTFVNQLFSDPVVVIAAGHTAGYVMQLAQEKPQIWKWVVMVAPTWRGPLPTMMGETKRNTFKWIQKAVNSPILGQLLYWLNTTKGMLKFMYKRHVFANPDNISPALIQFKQRLSRQKNARFASAAFVTGALDPLKSRDDWMNLFHPIPIPVLMVIGEHMPPKSRQEAEVVAHFGGGVQVVRMPGTLGLHEEYPETLGDSILPFLDKYLSK
jgi:pimeloyl-ACP methyl ester carboxylesterase